MKLKSISVALTESYDKKTYGDYKATAVVEGGSYYDNINVTIDPEKTAIIVDILAQAVADSMARAAAEFAADVKGAIAGPAIDQKAIEG